MLEITFPRLANGNYSITSPRARQYNCIAWAAGDDAKWWWPGQNDAEEYWPSDVARVETLAAFREAFATLDFVECQGSELELGFERIAFFANDKGIPTHAARQLPSGRWTSKLGFLEDIEHSLRDLEGAQYGAVVLIMKRSVAQGTFMKRASAGE